MERQLKERLIGAAVLVAAAVIMVPEMFSGPRTTVAEPDAAQPSTNQIKTYSVDLQSTSTPAARVETPVEQPAEQPLDEAQDMQAAEANPEIVAAAAPQTPEPKPQPPTVPVSETKTPPTHESKPAPPKPEPAKPASTAGWMVQVGSFSAQSTAQQLVAKLKGQGFSAFVGPVQVKGKTLYRVRVGALADRASAEATLQKLRGSYPGASIVAPGH